MTQWVGSLGGEAVPKQLRRFFSVWCTPSVRSAVAGRVDETYTEALRMYDDAWLYAEEQAERLCCIMPSKATLVMFFAGVCSLLLAAWLIADLSVKDGALLLAGMLIGGALYWNHK